MYCICARHPYTLFQIKKNSKKRYKYEVRRLKRQRDHLFRERLGSALSDSSYRDFWKEVRKVNKVGRGQAQTAPLIDGFCNDNDISNNFATKLRGILNCR